MAFTTVNKSIANHKNVTYTGNGGSQTITGVGFTPDFVWFKSMDAGNSHALVDSVRGTNRVLFSDGSTANTSISSQTFNSDGFALVADGGANSINSNSSVKTALSWRGGTTSGLSGGTITPSSYSFNAAQNVHLECLQYAHKNGCPGSAKYAHRLPRAQTHE